MKNVSVKSKRISKEIYSIFKFVILYLKYINYSLKIGGFSHSTDQYNLLLICIVVMIVTKCLLFQIIIYVRISFYEVRNNVNHALNFPRRQGSLFTCNFSCNIKPRWKNIVMCMS